MLKPISRSLNRNFEFLKVKTLYESPSFQKTLKETQQYYYALLHLNLSKPDKDPVELKYYNPDSTLDNLLSVLYISTIIYLAYKVYITKNSKFTAFPKVSTTFSDIQGIDECREELEEIVSLLKNRSKYEEMGAKIPRGILLSGSPGTGKTLLAKAIAGEAGVNFTSCAGSEFDEIFVGVGARRVRKLFQDAKENSPAIIFIDEIDSVGGTRRGRFGPGLNRQTLNQLLVEMDGFKSRDNIVVIAATNVPDVLDEALMRPGRFDKVIEVPMPDIKGRIAILNLYLSKVKVEEVDVEKIAKGTTGFTGADLSNLVNTAMLCAIKEGRNALNMKDIDNAKDRILLGVPNKSLEFNRDEKYSMAVKEIGHTLAMLYTEGADSFYKTSILLRGDFYGKTSGMPEKDKLNFTKKQALAMIDVLIAGRVMQEMLLKKDEISVQNERDLTMANYYANKFVMTGLFNELFGLAYIENKNHIGPSGKDKIDESVRELLEQSYGRVKVLLRDRLDLAKSLAVVLAERETLSRQEVLEFIEEFKKTY